MFFIILCKLNKYSGFHSNVTPGYSRYHKVKDDEMNLFSLITALNMTKNVILLCQHLHDIILCNLSNVHIA